MDASISNRFEKLREGDANENDEAEEQEEESVLHSSSKRVNVDPEPRLDDESEEEPSLRSVRKQRLTCTNLLPCIASSSFFNFNLQVLMNSQQTPPHLSPQRAQTLTPIARVVSQKLNLKMELRTLDYLVISSLINVQVLH